MWSLWRSSSCAKCVRPMMSSRTFLRSSSSATTNSDDGTHKVEAEAETAPAVLQRWMDEITSRPPTTHHDVLDTLRAAQLLRTLPTRQHLDRVDLEDGDELSQGGHMVYFQPETMLKDLGRDGSSPEYNAPPPFTRRMWAGGSISWSPFSSSSTPAASSGPTPSSGSGSGSSSSASASTPGQGVRLKLGEKVTEVRRVDKVEYKKGMVFVTQKREIMDSEGQLGVRELRTHVFRPPLPTPSAPAPSSPSPSSTPSSPSPFPSSSPSSPSSSLLARTTSPPASNPLGKHETTRPDKPTTNPDISFTYTPDSPLLFRYSALTFNAHKIHYDHPHATAPAFSSPSQGVESVAGAGGAGGAGGAAGPTSAAENRGEGAVTRGEGEGQKGLLVHGPLTATLLIELAATQGWLKSFDYRAVSPIIVDREVRLEGRWRHATSDNYQGQTRLGSQIEGGRMLDLVALQSDKVCMKATALMDL